MMTAIELVQRFVMPAADALLPPAMRSPRATALLLAIGLQESQFRRRSQSRGPARGFWQFEVAGVRGVLEHQATIVPIWQALAALRYSSALEASDICRALGDNDVLAACFARCLLWTLPDALPDRYDAAGGWSQYRQAWRPGRPRPETWDANFRVAWQLPRLELGSDNTNSYPVRKGEEV